LGTVQSSPLTTQITVLTSIAILMTVGVYGLVAGIVKIDDLGLHLTQKHAVGNIKHSFGRGILWFAPYMMKGLSIVGTAAMFLVGGGILTHGFPVIHHWVEGFTSGRNSFVTSLISLSTDAVTGILAGAAVLAVVTVIGRIRK
jgi:predicted DNA repair protein MutK